MPTMNIGAGDFGEEVAQVHESLAAQGFAVPEEERKRKFFGPSTRAAVVKFQTARGLEPTGHVSGQTAEQLAIPADGIPQRNMILTGRIVNLQARPLPGLTVEGFVRSRVGEHSLGPGVLTDAGGVYPGDLAALKETASHHMSAPHHTLVRPNQYHWRGGGVALSYYPHGAGVIRSKLRVTYQDPNRSLSFSDDEIRVVEVPDLGCCVSVTLVRTVDADNTTATFFVPRVVLPSAHSSVMVNTELITTIQHSGLTAVGHPQRQTYAVASLTGIGSAGPFID